MKVLVTGCAGFIGYHLCLKLINKKTQVYGIDNINTYYDVNLKKKRLNNLLNYNNFKFFKIDISINQLLEKNFKKYKYDIVIHLAAQAGVRYSIDNTKTYFDSNISGFYNILENSRIYKIKHLIFASSSSVYGDNKKLPLSEKQKTDNPLSFYAATKKINEIMAYSYSNIYQLKCTGLRFFTVYGPSGRPDMALFSFVDNIYKRKKIYLFNKGKHNRDFTYVDDAIYAILKIINKPSKKIVPFQIINIASGKSNSLLYFIKLIKKYTSVEPIIKLKSKQLGDVTNTHADIKSLGRIAGKYRKKSLEFGIKKFIEWYKKNYL